MFPFYLKDLDHLRDDKRVKFKNELIEFDDQVFGFTIVSYMIADTSLWKIPGAVECRGITYNEKGECCSVGFPKFFNYLENEYTQPQCFENEGSAIVFDKKDGSMVTPVLLSTGYSKKIVLKTKKSFYSDVAIEANKQMTKGVADLSLYCLEKSLTPIFEFTSKMNEIVIDYGDKPDFTLLAIRDNITGEYLSTYKVEGLANLHGVSHVYQYELPFREILENGKYDVNKEGWVIWFQKQGGIWYTGQRIKVKTEWYLKRHHAKTMLRERDIADMVIDETLDDTKSFIVSLGYDLAVVENIEKRVVSEMTAIMQMVEDCYDSVKDMPRKDIALRYSEVPHFGLLMKKCSGGEPDYKKFWIKNFREHYSLNTVYSTFKDDA